jgi:hypothetical protein
MNSSPLTQQTKDFIDQNPSWLNTSYATSELQYQLETVLTKLLVEGYVISSPFRRTRKEVGCRICGVKLQRLNKRKDNPFVCFSHKYERIRKAGLIHKKKKKPVV